MLGIIFTELIEGENVKLSTKGRYGLRAIVDLAMNQYRLAALQNVRTFPNDT